MMISGNSIPGRGHSSCKGPGAGPAWHDEQRGDPCGWSRVSTGERGRRGGDEASRAEPWGLWKGLVRPTRVGTLESQGQRRVWPDSGARASSGASGRMH